jgi:hypothetical protein
MILTTTEGQIMRAATCEGKRRMWRGRTLGNFKCGRKARFTFQTYTGLCRTHRTCGAPECVGSITSGYPVNNWRELG